MTEKREPKRDFSAHFFLLPIQLRAGGAGGGVAPLLLPMMTKSIFDRP
jgi:hypothetical protein